MSETDASGGRRGLVKTSAKVTVVKMVSAVIAAFAIILVAYQFGVSTETDALFMGRILPVMFATQMARAFSISIVPIVTKQLGLNDQARTRDVMGLFLLVMPSTLLVLVLVYNLLATPLINLVAAGLDDQARLIATDVTRILSLIIFFLGSAAVLEAFMNAHKQFMLPEILAVLYPLGTVFGALFLSGSYGVLGVPMGTLMGTFAMFILSLVIVMGRFKVRPRVFVNGAADVLKRVFKQIIPVIWGGSAGQLSNVVARMLAAGLEPGAVSVLSYAYRIYTSTGSFLGLSIGKVMLPFLSQHAEQGEEEKFRNTIVTFLRVMLFLFVPIAVMLVVLRTPVISVLLQHGEFSVENVNRTASVIAYFAPGIALTAVNIVVMRTFFSLEQGSVIFKSASVFLVVCVTLSYALSRSMGVEGLALANSLALGLQMCLILYLLHRRVGGLVTFGLMKDVSKMVVIAVVAGSVLMLGLDQVGAISGFLSSLLVVLLGGLGFLAIYVVALALVGLREARAMMRFLRRRVGL